jgi:hypothetical protein
MAGNVLNLWWALIVVGLCSGFLSGLIGVGGGVIVVPALVLLFTLPQKSAQGISLAVMVPVALLGAFRYWRNPEIGLDLRIVGFLAMGALMGTLLGTDLAARLSGDVLRKFFAVFMILVGIQLLLPARFMPWFRVNDTGVVRESVQAVPKGETNDDAGK